MLNFLPILRRAWRLLPFALNSSQPFFKDFRQTIQSRFKERRNYLLAAAVDLSLIIVIITYGIQPARKLVSPFVASLSSMNLSSTAHESFSFAPGQAPNKFAYIDLDQLSALAYFDVPVQSDGNLYTDSWGYQTFKGEKAGELFEQAHYFNTKILLTLSQTNNEKIKAILDDDSAQDRMISQAIFEVQEERIDGLVIDFEFNAEISPYYQKKFNQLIARLTEDLHSFVPSSTLAVAIPASKASSSYDLAVLTDNADRIFVVADDFATPEVRNGKYISPVYGSNDTDYWDKVSLRLRNFAKHVPAEKLVMERAWYGNGEKYPLYKPSSHSQEENNLEPAPISLDSQTIERLVAGVPQKAQQAARRNIPFIGKALAEEKILDSNVLAYALATIEHETDSTFEPIDEIQGRLHARRLGYEGGTFYFGRGFIQLTHLRNYRVVGDRIGLGDKLAKNPELLSDPEIAAKVLAAFFKDNNVANLASQGNFVLARYPINPDINGWKVAMLASKYGIY